MQNSTQLRGIHSGMVLFAQSNAEYYPGLTPQGDEAPAVEKGPNAVGSGGRGGFDPANRFAQLLNGNYFTPEFAISPVESKTMVTANQDISSENFSYAMLRIDGPRRGGRRAEWRATSNEHSVVISDRNLGQAAGDQAHSIHYGMDDRWLGGYATNDNKNFFTRNNIIEQTQYGTGGEVQDDDLFADDPDEDGHAGNDAAMVFQDATTYVNQK